MDSLTGGIQRHSRRLLQALNQRGVSTYVCARNYCGLARKEVWNGTFIQRSPVISSSVPAANSILYLLDALVWLIRNRERYDVIHCQQMFGPAMVGLLAKKLLRKPVLVRVTLTGETGEVSHVRRMALAGLRMRLLQGVDRWVALTTEMKSEISTLGVDPKRIVIIQNSTLLPAKAAFEPGVRAHYRALLGLDYSRIAAFTGRVSHEKGLDVLLHAWKLLQPKFPEAHLLLLGEGGLFRNVETELRALSHDLGLESVVHFLGHVDNVTDYLLASDLFILPTRAEGMSNALVEAMAAGTAIITTDIPANRDLIEDGENGLLVPPEDAQALAAAIERLWESPDLAEQLSAAAREKAETNLSLSTSTSKYLGLYEDLSRDKR
jgi:glycosyltransferase involved in cell wall biosynthesis